MQITALFDKGRQVLEDCLGKIQPHYRTYGAALWKNGVRATDELADADPEGLMAAGIVNRVHATSIIKSTARLAGVWHLQHLPT